jgi:hypothetical protein
MTVDPGSGAPMADRMQSLLSQAVEDQRSEQRQVAVALTEVRGQLTRVAAEIEALRAAPRGEGAGGGGSAEEAVALVSRDLREAVRMLAERLDAVGRSVQERGADIAEMKVAVQDLHSALRGHTNALGGVTQALAAVPALGERVGGLQDNLVSLHDRLAGLEEVTAAVDRLGLRIESADQDLRELRSAFTGMASRMAELPSRADLGASTTTSGEALDTVASRLARVESAIPELLSRIDGVREHVQAAPTVAGESARALTPPGANDEVVARLDAVESALVVLTEQLTAEPEERDDDEDAGEAEPGPIADQLAELTEGLFGEDGLMARLDGAAIDEEALDERITGTVQAAVAESEHRLTTHMDEAVLALAEALFRTGRRSGRPAVSTPLPAPVPPVAVPPVAMPPVPPLPTVSTPVPLAAEDEEYDEDEPEADEVDEADDRDEAEPESEATPAAETAATTSSMPVSSWQLPAPATEQAEPAAEQPDSKAGRRRPWWRPGD